MINLKEIKERELSARKILANYLSQHPCPIPIEDARTLVDCINDLRDLNDTINYLGEYYVNRTFNKLKARRAVRDESN